MDSSFLNYSSSLNGFQFLDCDKDSIFTKLWIVFTAIFVTLGLPPTLIVLKELHKRSHQRVSNELFMINLTIVDLAYMVVIPFCVTDYMQWSYGAFKYISSFADAFILCSRPLFMACICLDCYFAVIHPITYRTTKNSSIMRKIASLIVWKSTLCFSSFECIQSIPYRFFSAPLFVALPIIAFCDISILYALRKPDPTGKNNIHSLKRRALNTIFNSLVVTLTVYLPSVVIFSLADVIPLNRHDYYCKVFVFGFCFSMSGTFIMPVLYLDSVGKFGRLRNFLKKYISGTDASKLHPNHLPGQMFNTM